MPVYLYTLIGALNNSMLRTIKGFGSQHDLRYVRASPGFERECPDPIILSVAADAAQNSNKQN